MEKIKHNFGISEMHLIKTAVVFALAFSLFDMGSNLILCAASVIYPMLCSSVALTGDDSVARTKWLSYWLVLAGMLVVDSHFGFALNFLPLYSFLKLLLVVYLQHPHYKGSQTVYAGMKQRLADFFEHASSE